MAKSFLHIQGMLCNRLMKSVISKDKLTKYETKFKTSEYSAKMGTINLNKKAPVCKQSSCNILENLYRL